ncbi:MAG: GntR family transcriptional regulator [Pseudomonadota bacterium]
MLSVEISRQYSALIIEQQNTQDTTADRRVAATLRQMIVHGTIRAGEKISEVGVAKLLDVSRTPARLALRTLEVEGFIRKRDGRGFTVNGVALDDISKAYQVRGVLEGLAAGLMAEKGMSEEEEADLANSLDLTETSIKPGGDLEEIIVAYQKGNTIFHNTIMEACGNSFVPFTYERLESLPLLKLGVLVFNRGKVEQEMLRLTIGHTQHMIIFDALKRRDKARAEAMMREHSNATVLYSELV